MVWFHGAMENVGKKNWKPKGWGRTKHLGPISGAVRSRVQYSRCGKRSFHEDQLLKENVVPYTQSSDEHSAGCS